MPPMDIGRRGAANGLAHHPYFKGQEDENAVKIEEVTVLEDWIST